MSARACRECCNPFKPGNPRGNFFCSWDCRLGLKSKIYPKIIITDTCWTWRGSKFEDGYGRINLGSRGYVSAHRAMWEIHFGKIPDGLCVLHRCDNPSCVRPDHLWIGTRDDNNKDRELKGRGNPLRGSKHVRSKLNESSVREIRRQHALGAPELASRYGVSRNTIWRILERKAWSHV